MSVHVSIPVPKQWRNRRTLNPIVLLVTPLALLATSFFRSSTLCVDISNQRQQQLMAIGDTLFNRDNGTDIEILPCSIQELMNSTTDEPTAATYFHVKLDSFYCQLERHGGAQFKAESTNSFVPFVYFEISECPVQYEASTFRISASTEDSHFMGSVGPRFAVRDGCGIYKATVPVIEGSKTISIDLHWTSHRRYYTNRISDVDWAYNTKSRIDSGTLSVAEVMERVGEDRLDYLQNHLEAIPGKPFTFLFENRDNKHVVPPRKELPDCSEVPVPLWAPVGVFQNADHNSLVKWSFASSRCNFGYKGLDELSERLRGMRIKYLQDSHGDFILESWVKMMCPGFSTKEVFDHKYNCPNRTHTFNVVYQFFRAVYLGVDFKNDQDGISNAFRQGSLSSCTGLLGLGMYNATIIAIPTWIFVYETREGWNNIITAIESLLHNCKEHFPNLYDKHIVLIQTTTAVTSDLIHEPLQGWRGVHNFNIEYVSGCIHRRLGRLVDGIIPVFEMTYARLNYDPMRDLIHHSVTSYRDIGQVHAMGVISAMKARNMQSDRLDTRWFEGVPLQ